MIIDEKLCLLISRQKKKVRGKIKKPIFWNYCSEGLYIVYLLSSNKIEQEKISNSMKCFLYQL